MARPFSSCEYLEAISEVAPINAPLPKLPNAVVAAVIPAALRAGIAAAAIVPKWTRLLIAPPHHVFVSIGFDSSTNQSSHSAL